MELSPSTRNLYRNLIMTDTQKTAPRNWQEAITDFILNEAKFSDQKKILTHTKKQGEEFLRSANKRSPENIYINYVVSICESLSPATHVSKITHSSSNASSIIGSFFPEKNQKYVTSSNSKVFVDGAYDNAALSNYVKFLLLQFDGQYLYEELIKDHSTVLEKFSLNPEENRLWYKTISKQSYFPVKQDYHLLQILKSSSLLQTIQLTYFDKEVRKPLDKAKNQRKKNKFSETATVTFPNLAKLKTVQSQPQNVSVLNGGRSGGRICLFSAHPPAWKTSLKPPNGQSLFFGEFSRYTQTKTVLDIIAAYLVGYELAQLSQRHPDKYKKLNKLINQLVDGLCDYAVRLHNLSPNWSRDSKLKLTHQYWLDPHRGDADFQSARASSEYKTEIVEDFANWVNRQLSWREKGLNLGTEQQRQWIKMSHENFRLFNELTD